MENLIKSFRKEIEEDKDFLKNKTNDPSLYPPEIKNGAQQSIDRIERIIEAVELQYEILHVMGIVIKNCSEIIDLQPKKVSVILKDAVKRIKQLKSLIKTK